MYTYKAIANPSLRRVLVAYHERRHDARCLSTDRLLPGVVDGMAPQQECDLEGYSKPATCGHLAGQKQGGPSRRGCPLSAHRHQRNPGMSGLNIGRFL